MEFSKRYIAESDLLTFINKRYAIKGEKIRLYRTSQGRVFFIQSPSGRKVFKLYLPTVTEAAIQTTRIIPFLDNCGYPIVKIIPTMFGELYVTIERPEGSCIGVLFEYASGICIWAWNALYNTEQESIHPITRQFCKQVGLMHRLMDDYSEPLIQRGSKESIFGVMIHQLRIDGYNETKVRDLEEYGNELWEVLNKCRAGFYHADMHPGNTKYRNGQFIWMDFDKACMSYNIMDIGWLLTTGWIHYHEQMKSVERSRRLFDEVYAGYSTEQSMTSDEIKAAIHSTAIIHFEGLGLEAKMHNKGYATWLVDREYEWLMRWRECCGKIVH
jgi:Ser/Thr protein kinase RdoA (MazF antagonist)